MIDEKKLIEDILQSECVLSDANYVYRNGYVNRQKEIIDIINKQPAVEYLETNARGKGAWIPVSERLPEDDDYILVSFENFGIPYIARYEEKEDGSGAFYPGDDDKSYVSYGIFVNAWMPLPEPYKEAER